MLPVLESTAVSEKQRQQILTQSVEEGLFTLQKRSPICKREGFTMVRGLAWIHLDVLSWAAMFIDAKDDHTHTWLSSPYRVSVATAGGMGRARPPVSASDLLLRQSQCWPDCHGPPSSPRTLPTGSINNNWMALVHLDMLSAPGVGGGEEL